MRCQSSHCHPIPTHEPAATVPACLGGRPGAHGHDGEVGWVPVPRLEALNALLDRLPQVTRQVPPIGRGAAGLGRGPCAASAHSEHAVTPKAATACVINAFSSPFSQCQGLGFHCTGSRWVAGAVKVVASRTAGCWSAPMSCHAHSSRISPARCRTTNLPRRVQREPHSHR